MTGLDGAWAARLRSTFGVPLGALTEASLQAAVDRGAREDDDLDFKEELYGNADADRRELAADLAALGNHRGGLIVIGVAEANGAAAALTPVSVSDAESMRIRQIAADRIAPYLPIEVLLVASAPGQGSGFLLLAVPPSPSRPHAVRVDHRTLRYPRRDGTTKRWLAEPEIADLYRDRFRQATEQVDRLKRIADEAQFAFGASSHTRVTVALVPTSPGSMPVSLERMAALPDWADRYRERDRIYSFLFDGFSNPPITGAGLGRLTLRSRQDAYLECHTDGAGVAIGPWHLEQGGGFGGEHGHMVPELLWSTVKALRLLGDHALQNCGAYGDCTVELRVDPTPPGLFSFPQIHAVPIGHGRPLTQPLRLRHTLSLDGLVGSAADVLVSARILLTDIVQAFGLPEVREVASNGDLRWRVVAQRDKLEPFAATHGVVLVDDIPDAPRPES